MGALLGLIPLLTTVLPNMLQLAASPMLGNILGKAAELADKIFGTHDPTELAQRMQTDQAKLERYKAELQAATAEEQAYLADIQSARAQTVALAQSGSIISWGAPLVSVLVTLAFFAAMTLVVFKPIDLPDFQQSQLAILLGALVGAFTQVTSYWLGSSRGSNLKDATMAAMVLAKPAANGDGGAAVTTTTQTSTSASPPLQARPTGSKMFK